MFLDRLGLWSFIFSVLLCNFVVGAVERDIEEDRKECAYYVAPMKGEEDMGLGIFAGKFYEGYNTEYKSEVLRERYSLIESCPSFPLPEHFADSKRYQTGWYTFGFPVEEGYEHLPLTSFSFGMGLLANHGENPNMNHFLPPTYEPCLRLQPFYAHSVCNNDNYWAISDINPGEEVLSHYGESWFSLMGINYIPTTKKTVYTIEELEKVGHCLSHLYIEPSIKYPDAGKGLFSRIRYREGDVISISPMIMLPLMDILYFQDKYTVLMNYCIAFLDQTSSLVENNLGIEKYINLCLLPLGLVGMANHGGKSSVNMKMEWYSWKNPSLSSEEIREYLDTKNPIDLSKKSTAQLHIVYRATRDIETGEELLIDYGESWDLAWKNYKKEKVQSSDKETIEPTIFRHPVEARLDLLPASWYHLLSPLSQQLEFLYQEKIQMDEL